jgi:hypothetical protein
VCVCVYVCVCVVHDDHVLHSIFVANAHKEVSIGGTGSRKNRISLCAINPSEKVPGRRRRRRGYAVLRDDECKVDG